MNKIECLFPKTFFSCDSPIQIFDTEKNIFFFHPNKQKIINFNLPVGSFFTNNKIIEKDFTPYVNFKKINFKINPLDFKIIVCVNPHKATINTSFKTIKIDKSIANLKYKPCLTFLLCHECCHLSVGGNIKNSNGEIIFNAEKVCDSFATNYMLSHGFNPSQISICKEIILQDNDRKNNIYNETIKMNFRK